MGFVVLLIWVNGYVGFSWYVPLVLNSDSFFFLRDLCNVVEKFIAFVELG